VGWPTKLALAPDFADRVFEPCNATAFSPAPQRRCRNCRAADGRPAWEQLLP
jgi:hypothetical protein